MQRSKSTTPVSEARAQLQRAGFLMPERARSARARAGWGGAGGLGSERETSPGTPRWGVTPTRDFFRRVLSILAAGWGSFFFRESRHEAAAPRYQGGPGCTSRWLLEHRHISPAMYVQILPTRTCRTGGSTFIAQDALWFHTKEEAERAIMFHGLGHELFAAEHGFFHD